MLGMQYALHKTTQLILLMLKHYFPQNWYHISTIWNLHNSHLHAVKTIAAFNF